MTKEPTKMQCYDFWSIGKVFWRRPCSGWVLRNRSALERESRQRRPCVEMQSRTCVCAWDGTDGLWEARGNGWHQVTRAFTDSAKQCGLHPVATERPANVFSLVGTCSDLFIGLAQCTVQERPVQMLAVSQLQWVRKGMGVRQWLEKWQLAWRSGHRGPRSLGGRICRVSQPLIMGSLKAVRDHRDA